MATWYVETNGSDANDGLSKAQAFRSLNKAHNSSNPGDTVRVGAGTWKEQLILTRGGNSTNPTSSTNPIRWIGAGSSQTIIDGEYQVPSGTAQHRTSDPRNQAFNYKPLLHVKTSDIYIQGFQIKRSRGRGIILGDGPTRSGIYSRIHMKDIKVDGTRYHGIRGFYCSYLILEDIESHDAANFAPYHRSGSTGEWWPQNFNVSFSDHMLLDGFDITTGWGEGLDLVDARRFIVRNGSVRNNWAIGGWYAQHCEEGVLYNLTLSHDGTDYNRGNNGSIPPVGIAFNNEPQSRYDRSPDVNNIVAWNHLVVGFSKNVAFFGATDDNQTDPPLGDGSYSKVLLFNFTMVNSHTAAISANSKPTYQNVKLRNFVIHEGGSSDIDELSEPLNSGGLSLDYIFSNKAASKNIGNNSQVGTLDLADPDTSWTGSVDPDDYKKGSSSIARNAGATIDLNDFPWITSDSFFSSRNIAAEIEKDFFGSVISTRDAGFDEEGGTGTGGGGGGGGGSGGGSTNPADLTVSISNATDDVHERPDNGDVKDEPLYLFVRNNPTASAQRVVGLRFRSVNIPSGATINSAKLRLYGNSFNNRHFVGTIYGVDEDDCAAWSTGTTFDVTGRTKTTASLAVNQNQPGTGWYETADISTIVQEIIDRGGWSANNNMGFVIQPTNAGTERFHLRPYDETPAEAAQLVLNYTPGGSSGSTTTRTVLSAAIAIAQTFVNSAKRAVDELANAIADIIAPAVTRITSPPPSSGPLDPNVPQSRPFTFAERPSLFTPKRYLMDKFEIVEGDQYQREGESRIFRVDTKNWGGNPRTPTVSVWDITSRHLHQNVTSTTTRGTPNVSGNIITLPVLENLSRNRRYRVDIKFTSHNSILRGKMFIKGVE